jgi:hypothetical protein
MTAPSGSDPLANDLLVSLIAGKSFTVPEIDLSGELYQQPPSDAIGEVPRLTNDDLTTRQVNGSGLFDALMESLSNHMKGEYQASRITGQEYTKAYIGVTGAALQTAVQYLLGRDQSYWQSVLIQRQAQLAEIEVVKGRIELETARVMLARAQYEALLSEVNYALGKMKLATEDATYANLVKQADILVAQKTGIDYDNNAKLFTYDNILPRQKDLLQEQIEVQRAQTSNNRTDGAVVVGLVGKQKDLYTQQIESYKRDAETKATKLFTDAWITQKTIDEGLLAPSQFQNTNLDEILVKLRTNLGLGS